MTARFFLPVILAAVLLLPGCSTVTQTTSGQEYLSQYRYIPASPSRRVMSDGKAEEIKSIDERVREVAAVEPILKFPARIGLARIDSGALTVIPPEDVEGWEKTREKLGAGFGEFIPVNPLVAKMAAGSSAGRNDGLIDVIRLGAARQHLDAVLVYEVISKETSRSNILTMANASIIGGYILPSKIHDAEGIGNAILIDVMQGYPYGMVNTVVGKKSRASSSWGWGSDHGDRVAFAEKIKAQVAWQLAEESAGMFVKLRTDLSSRRPKK